MDTAIKIALVLFIGAASFSFGVYFGKIVADHDRERIKQLETVYGP